MKTILQIVTSLNSGAVGRIAEGIGLTAMNKGWKSYIAYSRKGIPSQSESFRIGSWIDIITHKLMSLITDRLGLFSRRATPKLIKEIGTIKSDIIHIHNIHGYYLNYPLLFDFFDSLQIPIVWTLHDCWSITGHCSFYESGLFTCNKWKSHCNRCRLKGDYPSSLLIDNSYANFEKKKSVFTIIGDLTLVPVSDWLLNSVEESFMSGKKALRIYNGINIERFYPHENRDNVIIKYNLQGYKYIVLGVAGVWEKRKGLSDFMALRYLLTKDSVIVLVELNKKQVEKMPDGVVGIEKTESIEELASLYSVATVFVNPTYADTFPTTNLESLACGTPVVTYRTGGSPEAIDEKTGMVVEKGDIAALKSAIIAICSEWDLVKTGGECRRRAELLYNQNENFLRYIDLYDSLYCQQNSIVNESKNSTSLQ